MGGLRPRGWALTSSLHVPFSPPASDGWAAATGAGLPLGSLHVPFSAWVGWVGRGHGAALSLASLHVLFWVGWVGRAGL